MRISRIFQSVASSANARVSGFSDTGARADIGAWEVHGRISWETPGQLDMGLSVNP